MPRKRTKRLTLVLLGSLGAMASGCGGCGQAQNPLIPPGVDPKAARQAAAAGVAAGVTDAVGLTTGLVSIAPTAGLAAPLGIANAASILDQADETLDVIANASGAPQPTSTTRPARSHYRYHSSPGIGWIIWGYALGRLTSSPYTAPRTYSPSPRPPSRFSSGGSSGFGRSSPIGGGSGRVSRGGFGSSGSAHASGGG
jgi:hypothetical protein